jgi:hypothetical protein
MSIQSNRKISNKRDAYALLIGEVMKNISPFYYLCECAYLWAEIGGLELYMVYEKSRKGTEYESVPFQTYSHAQWNRLNLNLKKFGVKKTFSMQKKSF